jgi:hypothetical protein
MYDLGGAGREGEDVVTLGWVLFHPEPLRLVPVGTVAHHDDLSGEDVASDSSCIVAGLVPCHLVDITPALSLHNFGIAPEIVDVKDQDQDRIISSVDRHDLLQHLLQLRITKSSVVPVLNFLPERKVKEDQSCNNIHEYYDWE